MNRATMARWLFCVLLLGAGAAAAAHQATKYGVTVTPEKNVDFKQFHSYIWQRAQPSADKAVDAQIILAVDRELARLGMAKVDSRPADVVVGYASLLRTDTDLKGPTDSKGLLPQYPVGTLVVVLLDPETSRRLLRMRVDLPIQTQRDRLPGEIDRAVAKMFAEYPKKPAK
jgi:hypothetical protein